MLTACSGEYGKTFATSGTNLLQKAAEYPSTFERTRATAPPLVVG
jgi:hypothetical protein